MTEREEQVRAVAVRLWEDAGKPMFRDEEFWLAAEQRLDSGDQTPAEYQEDAVAEQQVRTAEQMEDLHRHGNPFTQQELADKEREAKERAPGDRPPPRRPEERHAAPPPTPSTAERVPPRR
jgi:hypothetical protein